MAGILGAKKTDVKPPAPLPDETDPSIMAAGAKRTADNRSRGGRASTILSDGLGGGSNDSGEYRQKNMG
jgi:hypothetical protein